MTQGKKIRFPLSDSSKPCIVCREQGERRPIEILPNGGILFMILHDSGRICRWASYTTLEEMQKPDVKRDPTFIICPKCDKGRGRVNWLTDDRAPPEERPFRVKYIIVHGEKPGTWGKKAKIKKRDRCQGFNQEERDAILKQLGRYIQTPPLPKRSKVLTERLDEMVVGVENRSRKESQR